MNSAKTITFSSTHVAGQNVRFCFKYLGNTNFSASPWAQSDAFIVKAQPTIATVSNVNLVASQNKDVFTEFTITVSDGVNLASSNLIIVDASSGTTLYPATTTNVTCQLKSSTATTFTYEIAASSSFEWSVKAKYQADSKNLEAIGAAFSITSQYDIAMGTVSLTRGTTNLLWAYTNLEADASDYMSTDISSSFTFNNFTSYSSYNTHGISATIVPIDSGGNPLPLDSASGSVGIGWPVVVRVDLALQPAIAIVIPRGHGGPCGAQCGHSLDAAGEVVGVFDGIGARAVGLLERAIQVELVRDPCSIGGLCGEHPAVIVVDLGGDWPWLTLGRWWCGDGGQEISVSVAIRGCSIPGVGGLPEPVELIVGVCLALKRAGGVGDFKAQEAIAGIRPCGNRAIGLGVDRGPSPIAIGDCG